MSIHTLALGAGLLAGALAPLLGTVDQPWGTECRLAWCQPHRPQAPVTDALQHAADIEHAAAGRHCTRPDAWDMQLFPRTMVLTGPAGTVTVTRWTYPAPAGHWVERLCAR